MGSSFEKRTNKPEGETGVSGISIFFYLKDEILAQLTIESSFHRSWLSLLLVGRELRDERNCLKL